MAVTKGSVEETRAVDVDGSTVKIVKVGEYFDIGIGHGLDPDEGVLVNPGVLVELRDDLNRWIEQEGL